MRSKFGELLENSMINDSKIWLLTGDLGFGVLDRARKSIPERSHNVGAAEQLMLGAAVGLAHNNCIPICYSISPFVVFRPFEWIRNYLDHEQTPVKLVGAGRDRDYGHLGFSHWAEDDERALSIFSNIKIYKPKDEKELEAMWPEFLYNNQPCYLNIKRN
jgi:transketolase